MELIGADEIPPFRDGVDVAISVEDPLTEEQMEQAARHLALESDADEIIVIQGPLCQWGHDIRVANHDGTACTEMARVSITLAGVEPDGTFMTDTYCLCKNHSGLINDVSTIEVR